MCFCSNTVVFLKLAKFSPKRQKFDTIVRYLKLVLKRVEYRICPYVLSNEFYMSFVFVFICPILAENVCPKVTKIEANKL